MLQVTQGALQICRATVQQLSTQAIIMQANMKCLRLIESQDGMAISHERCRSDDELIHDHGFAVLAIPCKFATKLSEMTLDVAEDGRFILS